jgi:hypothetical protein
MEFISEAGNQPGTARMALGKQTKTKLKDAAKDHGGKDCVGIAALVPVERKLSVA